MNRVEPSINVYGSLARASAIADYVELLALKGFHLSLASLGDFIKDNGWEHRLSENLAQGIQPEPKDIPAVEMFTERVYSLLRERAAELDAHYPFAVEQTGRVRFIKEAKSSGYLLLLAITTAHAHKFSMLPPPWQLMQRIVPRILQERGWTGINFREHRDGSTFEEALLSVGETINISVDLNSSIGSPKANDAGVDAIGLLTWCRRRPGRWLAIGQVTCGNSNSWKSKIDEPSPESWRLKFGEAVHPLVFLAVPHHVEPLQREQLFQDTLRQRFLLDRLSLARYVPSLERSESIYVKELVDCEIMSPNGFIGGAVATATKRPR